MGWFKKNFLLAVLLAALWPRGTAGAADLSSVIGSYQDVRGTAGLVYGQDGSTAPTYMVLIGGLDAAGNIQAVLVNTEGGLDPGYVYPLATTKCVSGQALAHGIKIKGCELYRIPTSSSDIQVDVYASADTSGVIITTLGVENAGPLTDKTWFSGAVTSTGVYFNFVYGSGEGCGRCYYVP